VERMIMRCVIEQFKNKQNLAMDLEASKRVNAMVVKEYMNEFNGRVAY
jgi:type I restriction enzyme R subunit